MTLKHRHTSTHKAKVIKKLCNILQGRKVLLGMVNISAIVTSPDRSKVMKHCARKLFAVNKKRTAC